MPMDKLPANLSEYGAVISDDNKYRYSLMRQISLFGNHPVVFIMLNPSTADETEDDPTIRRCIGYARHWRATKMIVVNLFALRSTSPKSLWAKDTVDPVGPLNDGAIRWSLEYARMNSGIVVAAWGSNGEYMDRGDTIRGWGWPLKCLKVCKNGEPAHPLYLSGGLNPIDLADYAGSRGHD